MSEFFKRWSARKREAQQAASEETQPIEMTEVPALHPDLAEPLDSENTQPSAEVSTDKGSGAGYDDESSTKPAAAVSSKPALPDREALRAMFRSHQPDGLDDYTQDFSQPELLPAALTAGLRNWLVTPAPEGEANVDQADSLPATLREEESIPAADHASPVVALAQDHDKSRDILVDGVGQNVSINKTGMEPLGS